ncbi:MAG TPA: SH3 domain-containing protein [Hyphomicrobiaceae bacterium]|nr:SH3 domain-containing protein [Hyphomicrobiaceae bacterium]
MGRWTNPKGLLGSGCVLAGFLAASGLGLAAGRYEYRVIGVAPPDALNIRERPASQDEISKARIIGRIPSNAAGVLGSGATRKIGKARWYEVRYGDLRGWVNGRFLAPLSAALSNDLQADLLCSGAEPYWSLKVEREGAEFKRAGGAPERYTVATREPFQGRDGTLALRLLGDNGSISALVQHKEWCSNSANDIEYAFEVRAIGIGGSEKPLRGCCMLQR